MDYKDNLCCNKLESTCRLHYFIFKYLNSKELPNAGQQFKKKIYDASRKFLIEDYHGRKTLRLKRTPSLQVHTSKEKVIYR